MSAPTCLLTSNFHQLAYPPICMPEKQSWQLVSVPIHSPRIQRASQILSADPLPGLLAKVLATNSGTTSVASACTSHRATRGARQQSECSPCTLSLLAQKVHRIARALPLKSTKFNEHASLHAAFFFAGRAISLLPTPEVSSGVHSLQNNPGPSDVTLSLGK